MVSSFLSSLFLSFLSSKSVSLSLLLSSSPRSLLSSSIYIELRIKIINTSFSFSRTLVSLQ